MFDYIIIGATFHGCGIAAGLDGKVLVLEDSVVPGSDWALCFDGGSWDSQLTVPQAIAFKEALISHNALTNDGRLCVAALAPLMAEWCRTHGMNIEFSCSVVGFDETGVDAVGVQGPVHYDAVHVVDARPKVTGGRKFATGLMVSPDKVPAGIYGDFIITPSSVEGEYYLSLPMDGNMDWHGARSAFHKAWDERPAVLSNCNLLLIGTRFCYRNAPNPAVAIENGYLQALKMVEK